MADNIDPQLIEELNLNLAKLNETLGGEATVKKQDIKNFDDLGTSLKGSLVDMNSFKKAVTLGSKALGQMADGVEGVSRYNDAIETAGSAIATLGAVVATIVGGPLGLLAAGLGAAVYAGAKFTKAVNKQADDLYKSYKEISRAGVVGAGGLTEMFENMQKMGYGVEELGKFNSLLQDNSETLATLSGTALNGAKTFANMSKGFNEAGLDEKFLRLGISIDDQNKGMAQYMRLQVLQGQAGKKTQEELTAGAAAYIEQQDRLTKLTGMSADKLQEQREQAESEDRLGAKVRMLRRKAEETGDQRFAKQADDVIATYANLSKAGRGVQKGFADIVTGYVGDSKEAQQLFLAMPEAASLAQDELFDTSQFLKTAGREVGENLKTFDEVRAASTAAGSTFPKAIELVRLGALAQGKAVDERLADIKDEQDAAAAGKDAATKNLVANEQAQRQTRDDLQKLRHLGITPVTSAMQGLSKVIEKITGGPSKVAPSAAPERTGDKAPGGSLEDVKKQPAGPGKQQPATQSQKEFLDTMYANLLAEAKKQGVKNPEVIAKLGTAQSALETGYGKHTAGGNNYFGIKARPGEGGAGVATQEFINGKMVTVNDKFRKYGSMQESAADYVKFLNENKRYRDVLTSGTLDEAISAQGKTGYATDPQYAQKLSAIAGKIGDAAAPTSGYKPQLAVSKPEASLTPTEKQQTGSAQTTTANNEDPNGSIWNAMLSKLDEISRNSYNQANSSNKISKQLS